MESLLLKIALMTATLLAPIQAFADSFCGFDTGLIGTKAIGYVSPISLETHKYESGVCELNVFDGASKASVMAIHPCTDFQHVPTPYIDGYETEGFDPLGSDYFYLQAFDVKEDWVQISLKSGEKVWTESKYPNSSRLPYQYVAGQRFEPHQFSGYPTQSTIFSAPRLDKPDSYFGQYFRSMTNIWMNDWIDQEIPLDFFSQDVFKIMAKYDAFNPDHIEQANLATHYGDFFEIRYNVRAIVKDDEGREWLEAEEFLGLSTYLFFEHIEVKLKSPFTAMSETSAAKLDGRFTSPIENRRVPLQWS